MGRPKEKKNLPPIGSLLGIITRVELAEAKSLQFHPGIPDTCAVLSTQALTVAVNDISFWEVILGNIQNKIKHIFPPLTRPFHI